MAELHSEQWLADANRDFYWNRDQIQLMADRLGLDRTTTMLDAGCGKGHWTFLLGSVLPTDIRVSAIDLEPEWIRAAATQAEALGLGDRFTFETGDVMALDFADATFDLVTCQTLLMHLADPQGALRELLRVTKPGGTIMCIEPNSLSTYVMLSSANVLDPLDEILDFVRFGLTCERGKAALGEGNDSIGNLLPGYLAEAGAVGVQSFACDKTHTLHPPYASEEQAALRDYFLTGSEQRLWPVATARRYFLAGGGSEAEFEDSWRRREQECARDAAAIRENRFHFSGGWTLYLVAGQRSAEA